MKQFIDGIDIVKQTPILDKMWYTDLFAWIGILVAISTVIVYAIQQKNSSRLKFLKKIRFRYLLITYFIGLAAAFLTMMPIPGLYVESGRYTYQVKFNDDIPVGYIQDNLEVKKVDGDIWTVKFKQE